jgi:hypothetical protein
MAEEKQTLTQFDAVKRIEAEAAQITTRAKLAQLLNITYENRIVVMQILCF